MSNIPYGTSPVVSSPKDASATNPTAGANSTIWTGTTNFDAALTALVHRTILDLQRDALRWMVPGSYRSGSLIPGTNLIRYMAYGDLPVDDSLVAIEGEPNATVDLAIGYDEYGVQQRMRTVRITDVALDQNPHGLLSVAGERIARNMLAVTDWLIATSVGASTLNVKFAEQVADRASLTATGVLNGDEVKRAVTAMKKANIAPFADGMYVAMVDPNAVYDLVSDTSVGGWIEAAKYGATTQLFTGEIGRYHGVRFVESNVGLHITATDTTGGAPNVYRTVFFGPDYYAFGDLQSTRAYLVRPGGDHSDPASQSALLSWKGMYGVNVLGDDTNAAATVGAGPKHLILEHAGTLAE